MVVKQCVNRGKTVMVEGKTTLDIVFRIVSSFHEAEINSKKEPNRHSPFSQVQHCWQ